MAKVELRELRRNGAKDRSIANYVASLQKRGKIKTYISKNGYVAYDTVEYERFRKNVHVGRPLKISDTAIIESK